MRRRWRCLAVTLLALAVSGRPALAAEPSPARKAYDEATAAFGLGHYAEAAQKYETAFSLRPDPALLYDAAQAYRLAGNRRRALELYRNYLRLYPNRQNADEARNQVATLTKAIEEEKMRRPAGHRRSASDAILHHRSRIVSRRRLSRRRRCRPRRPLRCAGRDGHRAGARGGVAVLERRLRGPGSGSPSGPPWWWAAPWRCWSPPAATSSPTPASGLRRELTMRAMLDSICGVVAGHGRARPPRRAATPRAVGRARCS